MTNQPEFPLCKKLTLEDKGEIEAYVHPYAPYSDFNFTNLYCYNLNDQVEFSWLNGNLVVRFQDFHSGELFYSFIGSQRPRETIEALISHCINTGIKAELRMIPEFVIQSNAEFNGLRITESKDNHDYILSTDLLSEYDGEPFRQKRYSTKKFITNHSNINLVTLDLNLAEKMAKIEGLLRSIADKNKKQLTNSPELPALQRLLNGIDSFSVSCLGVSVDDQLAAFIIYEVLDNQFAIGHFEKSDHTFEGISPFLIQALAKELRKKGILYFNYEEDLGLEGLRTMKQRYRPVNFLKKYSIERIG